MNASTVREFLTARRKPICNRAEPPEWLTEASEQALEFCLAALGDAQTHRSVKRALLVNMVRSEIPCERLIAALAGLADDELLHLLDGLRLRKINGRRAQTLGLTALLGHARLAELAAEHRGRVKKLLTHFLGERTWSTLTRAVNPATPRKDRFLARILRFASDPYVAQQALQFLAGHGMEQSTPPPSNTWLVMPWRRQEPPNQRVVYTVQALMQSVAARGDLLAGQGMPQDTLSGIRGTFHPTWQNKSVRTLARSAPHRQVTGGPLTAKLKQAWTSGTSRQLALDELVDKSALTRVDAAVAVVLDMSASMISSGERQYHPAALGLATVARLREHVRELQLFQVGGSGPLDSREIPTPHGQSDLALAVLQAAKEAPDLIFVVTDGYENYRQGDVAHVVEGLRRLGLATKVEQVTPVIAAAEDLSRRRLGEAIPLLPLENETDIGELAARLLLTTQPDTLSQAALSQLAELLFTSA